MTTNIINKSEMKRYLKYYNLKLTKSSYKEFEDVVKHILNKSIIVAQKSHNKCLLSRHITKVLS